jgi:single-strand DNA-binding protein
MNHIVLIGRLARDPELRYSQSGIAVCTFTIAVDRPQRKDKEKETDFIPIVVFYKLGEICANHLKKGRLVAVEGRLQIRSYETKDGQKRRVAEVYANSVQFLDRAKEESGSATSGFHDGPEDFVEINLDDLPF